MTHYITQLELNFMTETELQTQLRETFNAMVNFEKFSQEYSHAAATFQEIKKTIRRKTLAPSP